MVRVLGIGGGAREHAMAEKIAMSGESPRVYWIAEWRNPGIAELCSRTGGELIVGSTTDPEFVSSTARRLGIDIAVTGPEEPNFHGVPDALWRAGIPCVGATRGLSIIERSKAELRRLQWRHDLPGKLLFRTFRDLEAVERALLESSRSLTWMQNVVLKPARQAGGKGVKVLEDRQAYLTDEKTRFKLDHTRWLMGYTSGYRDVEERILVEECVWGPEYTLQCFFDGRTLVPMPMVQDYKHAFDFDLGPETGGMGSISGPGAVLPFMTREEYDASVEVVNSVLRAIQDETGQEYKGIAAGQMMLTELEGPTVIEMYSRLGDPEGVNALAALETDLLEIMFAIVEGRLSKLDVRFAEVATVVKAVAPVGYPDARELARGHRVLVDVEGISRAGCRLYWGAAHEEDGVVRTVGSRVVEILATGSTVEEAASAVNSCLEMVRLDGWGTFYRKDIGTPESLRRRKELAENARRIYALRRRNGTAGKRLDWMPSVGLVDPSEEVRRLEVMGPG
ncbi:MAG: phosphoribosylamine--glycine ligase [Nitrososphaerota archaeon]